MRHSSLPSLSAVTVTLGLALPALAAAPSRHFVFWPEVEEGDTSGTLHALPEVAAPLYEQVGSERKLVSLPEGLRRGLGDAFAASESENITVTSLGTLVATVRSDLGSHQARFVSDLAERTAACLKTLDTSTEAAEAMAFLMDPQGDAVEPEALVERGEAFKPVMGRMLAAFKRDRCVTTRNGFEPNLLERQQLERIARTYLVWERDIVYFNDSDLIPATVALRDLYFGADGIFARAAAAHLRERLSLGMSRLSTLEGVDFAQSFETFVDFAAHQKQSTGARVGDADLKTVAVGCFDRVEDLFAPFALQQCVDGNRIVFHQVRLSGESRSVAEELP